MQERPKQAVTTNPAYRLEENTRWWPEGTRVSGTGSASVLVMSDEEKAAVVPRPCGFEVPRG